MQRPSKSEIDFKEKSPADFFYENMDVCGFDNPIRAIYTAVRELVENSLDACEMSGVLPDIEVRIEALNAKANIYKLIVKDNGGGIPPKNIPESFGKVFYSSKYVMRQHRGRFGMGGTMAVMYSQITTQQPVHIISKTRDVVTDIRVSIDIMRNEPVIDPPDLNDAVRPNTTEEQGTIIELILEGNYNRARDKIIEYIQQTAMVTPYANITFIEPSGKTHFFERVIKKLPPLPKDAKPHPHGIDLELFNRMAQNHPNMTVLGFLTALFQGIGRKISLLVLERADVQPHKRVKDLTRNERLSIIRELRDCKEVKSPDPSSLAPIGVELLESGIRRVLEPEFVKAIQRKPKALGGHPFIVEAAIAYGGKIKVEEGGDVKLYRFANRIPLLYDEWNDVSARVLRKINWKRYGVKPGSPVAVLVHICSTNIPYKTLGKEYIANRPELRREIRMGMLQLARELKIFLNRKERERQMEKALKTFLRYADYTAQFISEALRGKTQDEIRDVFTALIHKRLRSSAGG